jgi:hypothetical protein
MHLMNGNGFTPNLAIFGLALQFFHTSASAAELNIPEGVLFQRAVEYSNPDDQHLQLDLARPKNSSAPAPAFSASMAAAFARVRAMDMIHSV